MGALPPHPARRDRARRGPARGTDGELGGGPPQPRSRRRGRSGPDENRRRGGGRGAGPQRGAARAVWLSRRRRTRPPDRPGVRRRSPLRVAAPGGADRARARSSAFPTWSSTPSPTAATRCRTRAPGSWRPSRTGAPPPGTRESAASSAATTRWTATRAGSARSSPTTCSSTAAPSTGRPRAPRRSAPPTSAARPTSSSRRLLVGGEARIRPADDVVLGFNFRPDRMRQITRALAEPGFDEIDRGGAPPVARYATMAEYEEGWPYPVAFPPARPSVTLASVAGRARDAAAARRRDREVRPRHVLLQRRRGDALRGRGARADPFAARRADVRPQARR